MPDFKLDKPLDKKLIPIFLVTLVRLVKKFANQNITKETVIWIYRAFRVESLKEFNNLVCLKKSSKNMFETQKKL